ncbi:unnamed protein product [Protopolystoma xenopodis]|uniref:Uncharacterized protein n=1 Tax=Protopolystoma xenopodis TaxID=117903 RepID=A0A3S5AGU3_9PLAT|nr:unnamed protein product [Protopolystoma xenopodis]
MASTRIRSCKSWSLASSQVHWRRLRKLLHLTLAPNRTSATLLSKIIARASVCLTMAAEDGYAQPLFDAQLISRVSLLTLHSSYKRGVHLVFESNSQSANNAQLFVSNVRGASIFRSQAAPVQRLCPRNVEMAIPPIRPARGWRGQRSPKANRPVSRTTEALLLPFSHPDLIPPINDRSATKVRPCSIAEIVLNLLLIPLRFYGPSRCPKGLSLSSLLKQPVEPRIHR